MNILGVGGAELLIILIIMLVFAGPKRMIHWSYLLGQYIAKFRVIWSQTVDLVQKEFDEAGLDIQLPKTPPTRNSINKVVADAMKPVTQPVQESLDEIKKDVAAVKEVDDLLKNKTKTPLSPSAKTAKTKAAAPKPTKPAKPAPASEAASVGTWAGGAPAESSSNGNKADMGTWSMPAADE